MRGVATRAPRGAGRGSGRRRAVDVLLVLVALVAAGYAAWAWFGPAATVGDAPTVLDGRDVAASGSAPGEEARSPVVPDDATEGEATGADVERADDANERLVDASAANPVRVRVPSIGVDAPTTALGVDADNRLEVPVDTDVVGWWRGGPEPGEAGPAVVTGHVDSWEGPGVFIRLDEVAIDDVVHIDREDGTTATFRVTGVEQHAKTAFPTQRVYGDTPGSTLRLVTCGGGFDRSSKHYLDNVIVFAERVADAG